MNNNKLYVGNLSFDSTEDEIKTFFSDFGEITDIRLIKDFETGRWDLETLDKNIIKLPTKYYLKSLKNYLTIKDEESFKKFKIFDYRVNDQLIMK